MEQQREKQGSTEHDNSPGEGESTPESCCAASWLSISMNDLN